jgi:folate-binding protein YgfZ
MSESSVASGPLDDDHRARGARLVALPAGTRIPERFGDPRDEYRHLVSGTAVVDLSAWPELRLAGPDRVRFLNGLVTCRLTDREPGEVLLGFFTDVKGRILADAWLALGDEAIHATLPPEAGPGLGEHVAKYKIVDRVDIEPRRPVRLALPGEDGSGLGWDPVPPGRCCAAVFAGVTVRAERRPAEGVACLVLTAGAADGAALYGALLTDRSPVGHGALETARIEAGQPRFGQDYGPDHFPQETGLEPAAVAYDKGCYLGQEVVARIHYRGGVNRHLRGLEIEGDEVPEAGTEIRLDDRAVGTLTSVARSPRFERTLGLSILHRRGSDPGTEVTVGAARARVVELPFA